MILQCFGKLNPTIIYCYKSDPPGYAQAELIFRKDKSIFTLKNGWVFPKTIYFNGEKCVIPHPGST
jgi:hypothetical protein